MWVDDGEDFCINEDGEWVCTTDFDEEEVVCEEVTFY